MRRLSRVLTFIAGMLIVATQAASAAERDVDRALLARLGRLQAAQTLAIDAFPVGPTRSMTIRFQRVSIYAADAHVYAETPAGRVEVPRSDLVFLRGYADDNSARVALTLSPQFAFLHGGGDGPEGSFSLHATGQDATKTTLVASRLEADLPPGFNFQFRCGNETEQLVNASPAGQPSLDAQITRATQATAAGTKLRFAVVAIDTDSKFLAVFSNNTTNTTNYIAKLFNVMNLMYERDLQVQLQIGTTILRTDSGTDPYVTFTPGATTAQLDTFASNWKSNEGAVVRSFAILLSGAIASTQFSCSASGIAWIKQYCNKGTTQNTDTVGSYSVNQVCTSTSIDPNATLNARLVGHELGHNFGAWHTHCTDTTNGNAPVGTNTIDTCFTGEAYVINNVPKACYAGTTTCPAAGAGTIMSYCNLDGCPAGTQNLLQFHPTQINATTVGLHDMINAAPANCLNTTDDIFFSLFE